MVRLGPNKCLADKENQTLSSSSTTITPNVPTTALLSSTLLGSSTHPLQSVSTQIDSIVLTANVNRGMAPKEASILPDNEGTQPQRFFDKQ